MLYALRVIFIVLATILCSAVFQAGGMMWWQGTLTGLGLSVALVALELAFARKVVSSISVVIFGLVLGFIVARLMIAILELFPSYQKTAYEYKLYIEFSILTIFCFVSLISVIRAKDEFKLVIPFIELSKEGRYEKTLILDTSAIIDGRILNLLEQNIFEASIVIPRFVLNEIQNLADSHDKIKRTRGRRGLDILNDIKKIPKIDFTVNDLMFPEIKEVDVKLIRLAKMLDGKIATVDFNLAKVAQVQGIKVININALAQALKPIYIQGDKLKVKLVRPGENPNQAVGFLEDGSMIVVEDASNKIGQEVQVVVTNVIQTAAGRLTFTKIIA